MDLKSSCKAPWPHSLQNFSQALAGKALYSKALVGRSLGGLWYPKRNVILVKLAHHCLVLVRKQVTKQF